MHVARYIYIYVAILVFLLLIGIYWQALFAKVHAEAGN